MVDCIEDRATWSDTGEKIPVNTARPNPNGIEFDNLYLDFNGLVHQGRQPGSELVEQGAVDNARSICTQCHDRAVGGRS